MVVKRLQFSTTPAQPIDGHASRARLSVLAALATSLLLVGCSQEAGRQGTATGPTLATTSCRVAGYDSAVRCATYEVIENRDTGQGRKIALNVVIVPATARVKKPDPIFVFAGGPGQASTEVVRLVMPALGQLISQRDIVFIDQRGTGRSNFLQCKMADEDEQASDDAVKRRAAMQASVRECRDQLAAKADLTQYGTTHAMADYDEVRAALGYAKINLWGGSYGTRTAQEYLRRYPERVRSVILDGVASTTMALPATFARDASNALEAMFTSCERNPNCAKRYPELRPAFAELLGRLSRKPQEVTLPDPLTGIPRTFTVTRDGVIAQVFTSLYSPNMVAVLPSAITQAAQGNYLPMAALTAGTVANLEDKMAFGMRLSVTCAEDVPRIDAAARSAAAEKQPFGNYFIDEFSAACEVWPKGKVKPDFHTPLQSDVPVLIFSGGLDPVTPPSFGDEVKKGFRNSLHVVAPNVGHGVSNFGCAPRLIKQFIEKASVEGLDGECLKRIPRPTFYEPMQSKPRTESKDAKSAIAVGVPQ